MAIYFHEGDLPNSITLDGDLAVDTETMGLLVTQRDRLCLVQLSDGRGDAHLVQIQSNREGDSPNVKALLQDESRQKIFHYARFDMLALQQHLDISFHNVFCTKIASKLVRTYTDRHGLKDLCKELLSIEISKQQQCSDWGGDTLTPEQQEYAASDVLYLHRLRDKLKAMLHREQRLDLADACFRFLPTRIELDALGLQDHDIFSHSAVNI